MSPLLIARTWADDGHIAIRHKTEDARSVFSEVPNRRLSGFEQSKHEETRSALQLRSSVRSITAQFGHSVSRSLRSQHVTTCGCASCSFRETGSQGVTPAEIVVICATRCGPPNLHSELGSRKLLSLGASS